MSKKLILTVSVAVLAVGVASADLAVDWFNTAVAVSTDGTSGGFVNDNLVQLIYSTDGNVTAAGQYNVVGGAMLGSDMLLASTTDHAASPPVGFWGPISTLTAGDFSAGFFFTRIFSDATAAAGASFFDTTVVAGADWVYDAGPPANPVTVFSAEAISDVAPGGTLDLSTNGTVAAIPEPATFGLMGIAALGLFLARKKARR